MKVHTSLRIQVNQIVRMMDLVFMGLKEKPLHYGEGYRKGKKVTEPYKDILSVHTGHSGLDKSDVDKIEKNNWLPII